MKGDYVEVKVDTGTEVGTYRVEARARGRRVDVHSSSRALMVEEVTRGGTLVRRVTFMTTRVVVCDEHYHEPGEESVESSESDDQQADLALAAGS